MRITCTSPGKLNMEGGPWAVVVPIFSDKQDNGASLITGEEAEQIRALMAEGVIWGKTEEYHVLMTPGRPYRAILTLGVGESSKLDAEAVRRSMGAAVRGALGKLRVSSVAVDAGKVAGFPAEACVDAVILGQYRFNLYKKANGPEPADVDAMAFVVHEDAPLAAVAKRCEDAAAVAEATILARDLGCTGSNDLTPRELARRAEELAQREGLAFECFDENRMKELGMGALLGVGQGSAEPPRLIFLRYDCGKKDAPLVALVGKGVTFDTGGISIKDGASMHEMKYDMCGAAAVLGAMQAVARIKPAVNVVCVVPSVENCPGGRAQKPGDIVQAYNGKTIEVRNTDAEGRLILADALAYTIEQYKPAKVADIATLTGAAIITLGHHASAILSNDDGLAAEIEAASVKTGERVWRLPLWDDFDKLVEGDHGDLTNIGPPREAGTIAGGAFIKQFVGNTPWVHIDIAATAWNVKHLPYFDAKYPTGVGVRLLAEWVLAQGS